MSSDAVKSEQAEVMPLASTMLAQWQRQMDREVDQREQLTNQVRDIFRHAALDAVKNPRMITATPQGFLFCYAAAAIVQLQEPMFEFNREIDYLYTVASAAFEWVRGELKDRGYHVTWHQVRVWKPTEVTVTATIEIPFIRDPAQPSNITSSTQEPLAAPLLAAAPLAAPPSQRTTLRLLPK